MVGLVTAPARAQEAIRIADAACDGVLLRAQPLRRLLAIELADVGAVLEDHALGAVVSLRTDDCESAHGRLEITIVRSGATQMRTIELDGADVDSRERVAALAITELLIATRTASIEVANELNAGTDPPEPVEEPNEGWRTHALAAIGGELFVGASTGGGSLRTGVRVLAPRALPWAIEATIRGATGIGAFGAIEAPRAHWLGVDLGALALARGDIIEIGGGIGAQLGAAWLVGRDASLDHTYVDPTLVLSLRGAMTVWVASSFGLTVDLRAGWVAVGVELRSMGRVVAGISGPTLAIEIGLVIDPG